MHYLGIDLGGTHIACGVVDEQGQIVAVCEAPTKPERPYQEVIADGDRIKVILNGTTILDGNIREASKNGTIDKRDHPGLLNKTGHIGFLGHGSLVKFRNIRIKPLK